MSTLDQPGAGQDLNAARDRFDNAEEEDSALSVLLDGDIDRVMAGLDRIVEAAPSYRKLFSRWEKQGWNSESFDFTQDEVDWESAFTDLEREFMMWSLSSFFLGEERVTTE